MEKKGHIKLVLLKFGAVVALSLGGILYAYLRGKKIKPSISLPPPSQPQLDAGEQTKHSSSGQEKHEKSIEKSPLSRSPTRGCIGDNCSPCTRSNGEKDGYLLPEFNELIQDFSFSKKTGNATRNDMDPKEQKCSEKDGNRYELEIRNLRNSVKILTERERDLEIQLLEYYGLKEQEKAVMELQNRLQINNMEGKLFKLKIESLEADKKRLEGQVADHAKVSTAFEDAKAKIKLLKKKLRSEAEHNREQILVLQERLVNFQENEKENVAANQSVIQAKLQKIKELEKVTEDLKNTNNSLRLENSELTQKLEYVQCIATTVLKDDEKALVKEECQRLKQEKENLSKEIERLKSEHNADSEELIHLRWLNGRFRYEQRNHRTRSVEQSARDFNTKLPPDSEEKSNSDQRNSCVTDSGEDFSSVDLSPGSQTHKLNKTKVISKFMRLLRGKKRNNHYSRRKSGDTSAYIEDLMGGFPAYSPGSQSGRSTVTDIAPDGIYEGSRCSSGSSRLSSMS